MNVEGAGKMNAPKTPSSDPQKARNKAHGKGGDDKDADSKDGEGTDKDGKDGKGGKKAGDKGGDGAGDKEGEGKEGVGKDGKKKGKSSGKGKSDGDGESIEELLEKMDKAEKGKQPDQSQGEGEGEGKNDSSSSSSPGKGAGSSRARSTPKVGEWEDYKTCVQQLQPEIIQARALIEQIQERQSKKTSRRIPEHSMLPKGGKMSLFKPKRQVNLATKMFITGQPVTDNDIKRFGQEEERKTPASIDLVLLFDASGSMYWGAGADWPCSPIDACTNSACVLNEAARNPGKRGKHKALRGDVNVLTIAWGNDPPLVIAKPGDDYAAIGKAIVGLRDSQGWGTDLAPAIMHATKVLAESKGDPKKPVGFTHYIAYSDGDLADPEEAFIKADQLLSNNPRMTFDVMVIRHDTGRTGETVMEKMVEQLQEKHGGRVKLVLCNNPAKAHIETLALLRERMLAMGHTQAVPFSKRARDLQKAHDIMSR